MFAVRFLSFGLPVNAGNFQWFSTLYLLHSLGFTRIPENCLASVSTIL